MNESVPRELIAEIKQFIVENLEYETGAPKFSRREFFDAPPVLSNVADMSPVFGAASFSLTQLKDMLNRREKSFSEELRDLVKRSGRKTSEIYNRAQINRQLYSKIVSDPEYRPKKLTVLALALALELTLEQTKSFIAKAGYALTRSSVTDLVVEFFINRKEYNVVMINSVLDELDEPILGSIALEDRRSVQHV